MQEMYDYNKRLKTCLYSDYMIFSPEVTVFRNDNGDLLEEPYQVSFITAPAVNAGVVRQREPENAGHIAGVMLERIRYILALAAARKTDNLVLGAFGCGVFRNDPAEVADWFRQVIVEENYGKEFEQIVFAILDKSSDERVIKHFRQAFTLD